MPRPHLAHSNRNRRSVNDDAQVIIVGDVTTKPGGKVPERWARQDERGHIDKSAEYPRNLRDYLDDPQGNEAALKKHLEDPRGELSAERKKAGPGDLERVRNFLQKYRNYRIYMQELYTDLDDQVSPKVEVPSKPKGE